MLTFWNINNSISSSSSKLMVAFDFFLLHWPVWLNPTTIGSIEIATSESEMKRVVHLTNHKTFAAYYHKIRDYAQKFFLIFHYDVPFLSGSQLVQFPPKQSGNCWLLACQRCFRNHATTRNKNVNPRNLLLVGPQRF